MPGRVLTHSDAFGSIVGVLPDAPVGITTFFACFLPEYQERLAVLVQECSRHGTAFDEEMQLIALGGKRKWVRVAGEARSSISSGKRARASGLYGVLQDISAHKQAEQETLRLAMRLSTTLASITEAFVTLDRKCCFTYLNRESERLLLHTTRELLGKEVWQVLVNQNGQRLRQHLQKSIARNEAVELEDFYPGVGKWLEVRAYPFVEGLAVYFRDVTTRRKSQEQLMLLEACISRLNDIVLIANAVPDSTQTPYIVFVNQAFEQQTGYTAQEVLGQSPRKLLSPNGTPGEMRRLADLMVDQGKTRSELLLYRKDGSCFWLELEIVQVAVPGGELLHWVAVGRDISQRKASADAIHQLAFYDQLTALPNRMLLLNRLEQLLVRQAGSGQMGALMFIDVDKLKVLNDTLGHHKGDLLLQQVAARLSECVEETDTVARLGGDEFVVMLESLGNDPAAVMARARKVAESVLTQLREPFDLGGHQHYTTSSIGLTAIDSAQNSVSEVLKQADLAMYQAKTTGRNGLCLFDPDMQATVNAQAVLISELHQGLRNSQFALYYQPQVDRHGRVVGVEALLRWCHPARGLVMPADFIPMAEDTGLILRLGHWALATACEQLAAWARWPVAAGVSIAVNVSVRQFRHPDFVDQVIAEIDRTGISPRRLKLELTESLLADGMEVTLAKMGKLKALGVTLALDDFGTGYSSLSALKRLPLDQLKIDRSFVADLLHNRADAAISRTIITLAHSMGLEVVAEGVETQAQHDMLAAEGCDQFQGYFFARPLPAGELETYLHKRSKPANTRWP